MEFLEFKAIARDKFGTSNARRLRKKKEIPATIYSKNANPIHISLNTDEVKKKLKPHHHFYKLTIDSKEYKVFLKNVQKDHFGSSIYQIDFEIVEPNKLFKIKLPLKYVGQPKGVLGGGYIEYLIHEITVEASIDNVIEELEVDISHLELKQKLKVNELKLPKGITVKSPPPNTVLVIVREAITEEVKPKGEVPAAGTEVSAIPTTVTTTASVIDKSQQPTTPAATKETTKK